MTDLERLERAYRRSGRPIDLSRWLEALHRAGECERVCSIVEDEAIDLTNAPAGLRLVVARCYYDTGRLSVVKSMVERIVGEQPDHGGAWGLLYRVAEALGDQALRERAEENLVFLGWNMEALPPKYRGVVVEPAVSPGESQESMQEPSTPEGTAEEQAEIAPDEILNMIRRSDAIRRWLLMELPADRWDSLLAEAQPVTTWLESVRPNVENDRGIQNIKQLIQREG